MSICKYYLEGMMKKIALVTGGMRGLGFAMCKALYKAGYIVVTTSLGNEEKIQPFLNNAKIEGFECHVYKCNIADFESCVHLLQQIKSDIGDVAVLVNNAGITRDVQLKTMSKNIWDEVIQTNLTGIFNVTRQVIESMISNKFGRIINISSINGQKGQFGQTNYAAAKAGIHGFTMSLAQEVAKKGITVNTIAPGYIATEMVMVIPEDIRNKIIANIPVGRFGNPEEIAALVVYLADDKSGFITGSEIAINGGQHMM